MFVIEAGVGVVQIGLEQDPAPIAGGGRGRGRMGVAADGFIHPRGEVDAFARRAEHLQRAPLRSTLVDELPTPIRARRSLNTAPASIIAVTPWGTDIAEPSVRIWPGSVPKPIS